MCAEKTIKLQSSNSKRTKKLDLTTRNIIYIMSEIKNKTKLTKRKRFETESYLAELSQEQCVSSEIMRKSLSLFP